jgi:hypothetical protein
MLVYVSHITPRISYSFQFVLKEILNLSFEFTSDKQRFGSHHGPKINYSEEKIAEAVNLKPHPLLFETGIQVQQIEVLEQNKTTIFFFTDPKSDLPFDLFAATFYMVTRYEEYLSFSPDSHGRFPAVESLAFKNGFLEEPVVDQWATWLADILQEKFPGFEIPKRSFRYIPTIDIDVAWAYKYKGIVRTVGAFTKALINGNFSDNRKRLKVLFGIEPDPYEVYAAFSKLHQSGNLKPVYFFLVGRYGTFDKNHSVQKKKYRQLIQKTATMAEVGIHPSYGSNSNETALKQEIDQLSEIMGKKVEKSRQHFLKLSIPETYRKLNRLGIREDYTMGFSALPGFRAGTCTPFHFYDLEKEEQTRLRIFPFQVMDGTLNQYMRLDPIAAVQKIQKLAGAVKQVNGTFISLWHNESLSEQREWKNWSKVYEELLEICKAE